MDLSQSKIPFEGVAGRLAAAAARVLAAVDVYGSSPRHFTPAEIELLRSVADLAESALEATNRLADLAQIEASKSQFIRVTTHELRSPVTVSQSLIRTVLKGYAGPLADKQREVFSRISSQLDFLESLVNDLLDLAASKAPALATEMEPVLVNASVGRAVLLLQPRAEEKSVSLTLSKIPFRGRPCCDELEVWASEEGLDRIFVNLVGNAVKYTPAGGHVTVTLSQIVADPRQGRDEIQVSVADTGIGIPSDALPHLFEEFYRAPNAKTPQTTGTGLGLAIVKELVTRYAGRIAVESREGQGSTFTVSFPRYQPEG